MKTMKQTMLAAAILALGACGSATTSTPTDAPDENVGAAVGSLFGGSGESAALKKATLDRLAAILIREARAQMERQSACESLESGDGDGAAIVVTGTISAGAYGMPDNEVEVTVSDGCDEGGEYASFVVTSHAFTCTDAESGETSSVTMDTGSGVWRENLDTLETEIYGSFDISSGDTLSEDIRCSFIISHEEEGDGVFGGDCVDSENNAVEQASDVTCTDV
ncbi:MAG: hypothetical protein Q7T11_01650 [Deltaproteobacteria bacterium]|nr:hypothetical protein [Deltaproteobacteria bacterium]